MANIWDNLSQAGKTLLVPTPRLRTGLFNNITPPEGASKEQLRICSSSQVSNRWFYTFPSNVHPKCHYDLKPPNIPQFIFYSLLLFSIPLPVGGERLQCACWPGFKGEGRPGGGRICGGVRERWPVIAITNWYEHMPKMYLFHFSVLSPKPVSPYGYLSIF